MKLQCKNLKNCKMTPAFLAIKHRRVIKQIFRLNAPTTLIKKDIEKNTETKMG